MTISVTKTLPTSSWYSGSGATTITLDSANRITMNTKKSLIKTQILKSPNNAANTSSDKGTNYVKDLKKIEDTMKVNGWLVDTTDSSAWTKAWKLRAMSAQGGPVTTLAIENLTFSANSQQAFLEEVNFIAYPNRVQGLRINETSSASTEIARIEVDLSFYLGDAR